MYIMHTSYLMHMEGIHTMGIAELRRDLGRRIDAAYFHKEPTIIRNEKRGEPQAALVPYEWLVELYERRANETGATNT
jgi:hypothetical protein